MTRSSERVTGAFAPLAQTFTANRTRSCYAGGAVFPSLQYGVILPFV
jgi:hypothetical protein